MDNANFTYMMYLAGCGAQAVHPKPPTNDVDWNRVLRYALEQSVSDLVSYAITLADFNVPACVFDEAKQKVRQNAVVNTIRRMGIQKLLEECENQGIQVAVIKGFAIADDYALPEVRSSADTDLYVRECDEEKALQVFLANGFTCHERVSKNKDTHLHHTRLGSVELHVRLFEDFIYKIWYESVNTELRDSFVKRMTKDGVYYTLSDTDHLLFVILHMMKHFIVEGCSLKMLLDISILLMSHAKDIDITYIKTTLEMLRYTKAIQCFLRILCLYCEMDLASNALADNQTTDMDPVVASILEDMEQGGTRGYKDTSQTRQDGMRIYNAMITKRRMNYPHYRLHILSESVRGGVHALFPSREIMATKYAWLKKKPWLYPLACIFRIKRLIRVYLWKKEKKIPELKMMIDADDAADNAGANRARMFSDMGLA